MEKPRSYRSFTQSGRGEIARTVPPMVIGSQALSVAIMGPSTLLTEQTRSSTPGFWVSIWAPEEHSLCPGHLHKLSTQQRGCHMVAAQQTFAQWKPYSSSKPTHPSSFHTLDILLLHNNPQRLGQCLLSPGPDHNSPTQRSYTDVNYSKYNRIKVLAGGSGRWPTVFRHLLCAEHSIFIAVNLKASLRGKQGVTGLGFA